MTLSKAKWRNTLHSDPVWSPTIYNQATSTVHRKDLNTIIINKRYILRNEEKSKEEENIENIENIRKGRKRNIIWFNPPYNKLLTTNIGKYFFRILNKHFPSGDKLYKLYKKKALKLSYSCMPNLNSKIDGHNKKILEATPPPKTKISNCLEKESCPRRGACLTENIS